MYLSITDISLTKNDQFLYTREKIQGECTPFLFVRMVCIVFVSIPVLGKYAKRYISIR